MREGGWGGGKKSYPCERTRPTERDSSSPRLPFFAGQRSGVLRMSWLGRGDEGEEGAKQQRSPEFLLPPSHFNLTELDISTGGKGETGERPVVTSTL